MIYSLIRVNNQINNLPSENHLQVEFTILGQIKILKHTLRNKSH